MLQKECFAHRQHHAAKVRDFVQNAADPAIRSCFLDLGKGWTLLSASEELAAPLERFCVSRGALLAPPTRVSSPRSTAKPTKAKRAGNTVVAIVDDDPWACEGMNSFVVSLGYRGVTFHSAEDYLQSELKQHTQCLILDVHLGGMSGLDLQSRLLADGYCTPIIFVTARFEEHVRSRVMGAGAFGYLRKPWDEGALISCLERAVRA